MMKQIVFLSSWLLFCSLCPAQQTGELSVSISDISASESGNLVLMVFDSEAGFPRYPDQAVYVATVQPSGTQASHTFSQLPTGIYAVSVFHDQNKNGELDANFLGLPKEPVGASNLNQLGKPSFNKCSFAVGEGSSKIAIRMLNN